MVLPAVAATGRVIAGSTRATTRTTHAKRDPRQRPAIRHRRDERLENGRLVTQLKAESPRQSVQQIQAEIAKHAADATTQSIPQHNAKKPLTPMGLIRAAFRTIRAVAATLATMSLYLWFYCIQLAFGILFIVMGYITSTWTGWAASFFYDLENISIFGWAVCSIISLVFMFIALVSLVTVRAKVSGGLTMIMFLIGIAGSIVPYLNLLPWPAFFMVTAVANQK